MNKGVSVSETLIPQNDSAAARLAGRKAHGGTIARLKQARKRYAGYRHASARGKASYWLLKGGVKLRNHGLGRPHSPHQAAAWRDGIGGIVTGAALREMWRMAASRGAKKKAQHHTSIKAKLARCRLPHASAIISERYRQAAWRTKKPV